MEEHSSTPPRTYSWKLSDIPVNDLALCGSVVTTTNDRQHRLLRSFSSEHGPFGSQMQDSTQSSEINSTEQLNDIKKTMASFRIRPATPRINLLKKGNTNSKEAGSLIDIFSNFDDFIRRMIDKGEDVDSEQDLYLKLLSEYLEDEPETIKKYTKIEIMADTSNLSLQALGDVLPQLIELKLNGSIIHSLKDVGTSFKTLKVLWVSRVGLRDLSGLEELYASYNFISDISDIEFVDKLHTLDLEANNIDDMRQLSYISPKIKYITLSGNKVTQEPGYLENLLTHAKGLESIDEIPVETLKTRVAENKEYAIESPVRVIKKLPDSPDGDEKIIERLKKLGLQEEMIRESISQVDSMMLNEPQQEEILRQSIKAQGFQGENKGKLKAVVKEKPKSEQPARPATASVVSTRKKGRKEEDKLDEVAEEQEVEEEANEPKVEGFSELVSATEKIFAGNPLQAAKHKKSQGLGNAQKMDIYSLIDQFKGATTNLKMQISKKMAQNDPIPAPELRDKIANQASFVMPEGRMPVKARGMINIKKIKYLKK